jgi:hypothetical protein
MSSLGRTVTRKQLPIFHQLGVKFLISSLVTLSGFASVVSSLFFVVFLLLVESRRGRNPLAKRGKEEQDLGNV